MSKKRKHGDYPRKYEKDKLAKFELKKKQKHSKRQSMNNESLDIESDFK